MFEHSTSRAEGSTLCAADSAGSAASASGNYNGGPWVWLGGNSCQVERKLDSLRVAFLTLHHATS